MGDLETLKSKTLTYLNVAEKRGSQIGEVRCPHCNKMILVQLPKSRKAVWDASTKCYECGELNYLIIRYSGVQVEGSKAHEETPLKSIPDITIGKHTIGYFWTDGGSDNLRMDEKNIEYLARDLKAGVTCGEFTQDNARGWWDKIS